MLKGIMGSGSSPLFDQSSRAVRWSFRALAEELNHEYTAIQSRNVDG